MAYLVERLPRTSGKLRCGWYATLVFVTLSNRFTAPVHGRCGKCRFTEVELMPNAPLSPKPSVSPNADGGVSGADPRLRLFWLCLGLGLLAVVLLIWMFGLTWWTVLIAALAIACPAGAAWILLGGLDTWPKPPRNDR